MAVELLSLRDDREGWDKVGEVRDGEFTGDEEYRERLEEADIDLDDEEALVETFDNPYFTARRIDDEE